MRDGRKIYVLGEGRLINLAAAEGHPASVMDMSFANQALSAEYMVKNHATLEKRVYSVPEELDKQVAKMKLESMGVEDRPADAGAGRVPGRLVGRNVDEAARSQEPESIVALVEGCKHSLEITVPVAEVEKETERVVAEIQKKVKLPGFRPGKAPVGLVKTRFAGDIRQDVLEKLVPRFFRAAAEKEHLRSGRAAENLRRSFPRRRAAEVQGRVRGRAGDRAEGISRPAGATTPSPKSPKKTSTQRLEEIREQKAEYVNEEPRPLADGDYAVVSLESLSGVAEKISQDEMMLKIGDEATHAGVHRKSARRVARGVARVRRHLSGGLRAQDAGRAHGTIPRDGESRPPQGTARAERRVRQGSGRLPDARRS